ncbi:hypothetical protein CHUAL_010046 [Chamberlinius hualienensis]
MAFKVKINGRGWLSLSILVGLILNVWGSLQQSKSYSLYCKTSAKKIKCNSTEFIHSIEDIYPSTLPSDTTVLDLSGNSITELENSSLSRLIDLENLNFAHNEINIIHPGAFRGLNKLKFLNLSYNNLRAIDSNAFKGLPRLKRLYLSKNYLSRIPEGTFGELVSLRYIDLANNPLICDCHLHWILKWIKAQSIQLTSRTNCPYPSQLNSKSLVKLKDNQWQCDLPPQVTFFTLKPSQSQVVFSGDSLQFQCQVSNVDSSIGLFWTLNDKEIEYYDHDDLISDVQSSTDGMLLLGSLIVQNLTQLHTGNWSCWVNTTNTNDSRSVFVRVLSESTRFCSETVTTGNKGNYLWPRTVAGVKVELPCWSPVSMDSRRHPKVSYVCSDKGEWELLDTSSCPYVSEVTKVLEQFAKTNFNITSSSVIETVHRLKNYTGDGNMLTDKMDVVFIGRTITQYLEFVPKYKEIGDVLIDIISVVMSLNDNLLRAAEMEDRACSKLTATMEKIPELLNEGPVSKQSSNIAVEKIEIDTNIFRGITCASFTQMSAFHSQHGRTGPFSVKKSLRCLTHQNEQDESELLEASIYLPASLATHLEHHDRHDPRYRIQMIFYKNANLFPQIRESNKFTVVSGVIGSNLVRASLTNLSEPVFVTLRSPNAIGKIVPALWSQTANGGFGEWSSKGCKLRNMYGNLVAFQCDRLGYYGILQDAQKWANNGKGNTRGAEFRLLHPVVYVGSAICVHCLIAVIITYILGFRLIHIPKKNKHSLVNVCISMTLLCLAFTLGIRHTEEIKICQSVGLVLHYLTLVSLVWMVIIASNTYKKLNRSDQSDFMDEPPSDYPVPPKPMLRFYLVGWGVPVIICGISAAVNLEDYAGYDYCFLPFTHSIGAFYGPCGAILFLLFIFYLLIFCSIRKIEALEKREQNARDGTEMELMATSCSQPPNSSRCVNHNRPSSETSSEEDDLEQPLFSQLRAQIVILLLFLLSWAMAALSTTEPFSTNAFLAELLFGCAYAASVTTLGVFVVVFHCATREDVRLVWKMLYHCRESGIVRETVPLPQTNATNIAGTSEVRQSNDSLNSSYTSKSCSTSQSVDGAKARLPKISNLEAAMVMTGGVTDTSWSGEMFFNPYQNGVARKYFKKRAKQLQKSKNECPPLEEEPVVEVNHMIEVDKLLPGLVPIRIKDRQAVVQCTNRAVKRDQSTESQLCSSSSQGLVSMSPSLSIGNRSDRSLLIVEEEEEFDQNSDASQKTPTLIPPQMLNCEDNVFTETREYADVDWGGSNIVSPRDMQFSPPTAAELYTPTPTEPETKDISISCDLNDFCNGDDFEIAAAVASSNINSQPKVGSEDNICSHYNELAQTNGIKKLPQRSGTLPRSNWEKQFALSQRSNQPTYAYVNHSHHQNVVCHKRPKYEVLITRSTSVGDTELSVLTKDTKKLNDSQPSLHIRKLVYEQIGNKETAV